MMTDKRAESGGRRAESLVKAESREDVGVRRRCALIPAEPRAERYLVTGGAGFIGANFVKWLLRENGENVGARRRRALIPEVHGVEILVVDALTYAGHLPTIQAEIDRGEVQFLHADIGDRQAMERALEDFDPDYIVNFAAESHVDRSIEDARPFVVSNVLGTQNLLECARRAWKGRYDTKRFLQIGTDEVYGSLEPYADGEARPLQLSQEVARVAQGRHDLKAYGEEFFTEDRQLQPRSPYSASKTSADLLALAYHHTYGLPTLVTRCSNNYGPYQFPEKLIPLMIDRLLHGGQLPVYGRGLNVRDWLYVDDHCHAIDTVLHHGRVGEVYNVGGFNEQRNIDIVHRIISSVRRGLEERPALAKALNVKAEDINESRISYVTDRLGHDLRYAIDPTKIARELGWTPQTPFEKGIELTVAWYLDNQPWVDSLKA